MAKRYLSLLLIGIMALTAFAGCTQPPAADPGTTPSPGKTDLVIAIKADVATLHPTDHSTTAEMDVELQIYDTLFRVSLDGQ